MTHQATTPSGYDFVHVDRAAKQGGGVGLYVGNNTVLVFFHQNSIQRLNTAM